MIKGNPMLSRNIQTLLAVAETKSTHAASKKLNISQTAVTKRIKQFETALGELVFSRSPLGMALTPKGRRVLQVCHSIKGLSLDLLNNLSTSDSSLNQAIQISGPYSIMKTRILPLAIDSMKATSGVKINLDIHDRDLTTFSLQNNQLAIIPTDCITPDLQAKQLKPEYYQLFSTLSWQHRSLKDIFRTERIIDIDCNDTITDQYLAHYKCLRYIENSRIFSNNTEMLNEMILCGVGYGVINTALKNHLISTQNICLLNDEKMYENQLSLVWKESGALPRNMRSLIDLIN